MESSKRVTMKDVAREAGVALGTVSRVINGFPVGDSYQQRVEAAMKKLGYHINPQARSLRSSKSSSVGVILPDLDHPYFSRLADCLCRELSGRSLQMLLFLTQGSSHLEQEYLYLSEQQMVSGIICLPCNSGLRIPGGIPVISIDGHPGPEVTCVSSDNYGGGYLAAQKLLENGCKNPAFLYTVSSLPSEADKRRDGFVRACTEAGVSFRCERLRTKAACTDPGDFVRAHLHDGRLEFDGLFCMTDRLALQVCEALRREGLRVPEDVQMIGYGGVRRSEGCEYTCSTILQPAEEMAKACVDLVLQPFSQKIPCTLQLPVVYAAGGTTRDS